MELSVEQMFGYHEAASVRDSGSEVEDDDNEDDDGGQNNPMEEAVEVPEPGRLPCPLYRNSINEYITLSL